MSADGTKKEEPPRMGLHPFNSLPGGVSVEMSADGTMKEEPPCMGLHPFNTLPGDPSLHLVTNVDLGDKKMEIMKGKIL